MRVRGQEGVARLEQLVHERPLTSLAAAVGIGMILTRILERR